MKKALAVLSFLVLLFAFTGGAHATSFTLEGTDLTRARRFDKLSVYFYARYS